VTGPTAQSIAPLALGRDPVRDCLLSSRVDVAAAADTISAVDGDDELVARSHDVRRQDLLMLSVLDARGTI
jgi:hypothetical protein